MEAGRDHPSVERQGDLDDSGDPRGGLQMTDVGFHRTNEAGLIGGPTVADDRSQGGRFDRVAEKRPGAVRLDVIDLRRSDPGAAVGGAEDGLLCLAIRCGQTVGAPILVQRAAAHDGVNEIAVGHGLIQRLQDDHAGPLAPHVAIGGGVERLAATIGREEAGRSEDVGDSSIENEIHAAGQGQ